MTRTARILGLAAAVLGACGCGDNAPTTGTATFTGAATGSLAFYALGNSHPGGPFAAPGETVVALSIASGAFNASQGSLPFFGFDASFLGATLQAGTFAPENTAAQASYTNQERETWVQLSPQNLGTFSLTLSSVGPSTSTPSAPPTATANIVWYSTHGFLTATLVTQSDNPDSRDVNVTLAF